MARVTFIVAVADNGVIGRRDGGLPWSLPADLARFKRVTWGHTMIMGRRTFEAIGRALPGRRSIVVSRNAAWSADGVEHVTSVDAALDGTAGEDEVFVIGGGEIYALALPRADRLDMTFVHMQAEGEVRFPKIDWGKWRETRREPHPAADGRPAFTFADYLRV